MTDTAPARVVALVGRPNVGKSAIFNRLVGRRLAIVHSEVGVTRDRIVSEARWEEQRFELIDTGGIGVMDRATAPDSISEGARRQVDLALGEAAAIVMVVDVQAGILPLDTEVARLLHRHGRPVFIAANKADNPDLEEHAAEFAALGFPVYPVSALHGLGFGELMAPVLAALPPVPEATGVEPVRIAVVGRPNAGKSSYVNRLLGAERVIVSEVPGTTRDSIEIPFRIGQGEDARHYLLVDTAGMRHRRKVDNAVERFSLLRVEDAIKRADLAVLVFDAVQGPGRQDKRIADLVLSNHKGCLLLVNKWDLSAEVTEREYGAALRKALPFLGFAPLLFASARTGWRVRESIEAIDRVAAQVSAPLSTGVLNRVLHAAVAARQPPAVKGRRLKLFYATQVGTRPPRLRLFVNNPALVVPAYEGYLVNALRRAFGLEGAPVVLHYSRRSGK